MTEPFDFEDKEPEMCGTCSGTGMPISGPPDRGHCDVCGGSGVSPWTSTDNEHCHELYDEYPYDLGD